MPNKGIDIQKIIQSYANQLADEGEKIITEAFKRADFSKDKTQNLHDSYGSCVFYNGKEVEGTRRYLSRLASTPRRSPSGERIYGRDAVENYFNSYTPKSKGFELVTVASIFYAEYLEHGAGNLTRKYKVISQVHNSVSKLAAKVGGTVVPINI